MNRTIYLLRDNLSGRYYTQAGIEISSSDKEEDDELFSVQKTFENAVIHTTLKSAQSGAKNRISKWKNQLGWLKLTKELIDQRKQDGEWLDIYNHALKLYNERKCTKTFGVEIVSIDVPASGAKLVPLK